MTDADYKRLVLTGLASRGILRYRTMCKQAALTKAGLSREMTNTLGTSAATATLGALIQAARGKSILKGILTGGILGAGAGSAYNYGLPMLKELGTGPFSESLSSQTSNGATGDNGDPDYYSEMPESVVLELKRREKTPSPVDSPPPPESTFYRDLVTNVVGWGGAGYGGQKLRKWFSGKDKDNKYYYDIIRQHQADTRKGLSALQKTIETDGTTLSAIIGTIDDKYKGSEGLNTIINEYQESGKKEPSKTFKQYFMEKAHKTEVDAIQNANNNSGTGGKSKKRLKTEAITADPAKILTDAEYRFADSVDDYQRNFRKMEALSKEHPVVTRRLRDLFKPQVYTITEAPNSKKIWEFLLRRIGKK